MTLDAGDLNRRITIQAPGTARDAAGQPIGGWIEVATVWADVRQQSGLQAIKADAPMTKLAASIRIRWRQGVEDTMRVLYDGQVYTIATVIRDPRRMFMDLVCEATK
ncbi:phage head closure protein [Acidovorax sp. FG27]|uniref:phage head closure protein n=1 Tax=Acidovorax sp. FG27 TaxID=3133652 RepID=UPI0030E944E4